MPFLSNNFSWLLLLFVLFSQGATVSLLLLIFGSYFGLFMGLVFNSPLIVFLILFKAIFIYFFSISAPAPRLLFRIAATIDVPVPTNGSKTQSSSLVIDSTNLSIKPTGNWHGCSVFSI